MVNLKKWEKIEHDDVNLGDELKIVWTKTRTGLKTTEVHKGFVRRIDYNRDFYVNGVGWEEGDSFDGTKTTIYRRKPEAFDLPTEFGAIISGVHYSGDKREWLVFDGEDWCAGLSAHDPSEIRESFLDLRLERVGIERI